MFTQEEVEQHIEGALVQYDQGHNERAALRAQIAQAEALTLIALNLGKLAKIADEINKNLDSIANSVFKV